MTDRFAMIIRLGLALLLVFQPAMAVAGSLDWLVGRWAGTGTIFGNRSEATLQVTPALEGAFMELRYQVKSMAAAPPFLFEGRALYRERPGGDWEGRWFDSRGKIQPVMASVSGQILTSGWGTAETERGQTIYRLLPDGRLEVVDTVLQKDHVWREFARQSFTKLP